MRDADILKSISSLVARISYVDTKKIRSSKEEIIWRELRVWGLIMRFGIDLIDDCP